MLNDQYESISSSMSADTKDVGEDTGTIDVTLQSTVPSSNQSKQQSGRTVPARVDLSSILSSVNHGICPPLHIFNIYIITIMKSHLLFFYMNRIRNSV